MNDFQIRMHRSSIQRANDKVARALRENEKARSDDRELLLDVWESEGLHLDPEQKLIFLSSVSTPESITRARRKLQERGAYPASRQATTERRRKATAYRQVIGSDKQAIKAISWLND